MLRNKGITKIKKHSLLMLIILILFLQNTILRTLIIEIK